MKLSKALAGFTLLEVLVALAVAGIGLAGVIKVAGGNAYNAQYLQEKTLAQWVAMNQISKLRVTKAFPSIGDEKGDAEMADKTWYWKQVTSAAPFAIPGIAQKLRQVEVSVYAEKDYKGSPLAILTTFVANKQ